MIDLEAIKNRIDNATRGDWYRQEYYQNTVEEHLQGYEHLLRGGYMDGPNHIWPAVEYVQATIPTPDRLDTEEVTICIVGNGPTSRFNAVFIEHAYTDILALVTEIERLRPFACSFCGARFASQRALIKHGNKHQSERA